jgi:hypothetical protein
MLCFSEVEPSFKKCDRFPVASPPVSTPLFNNLTMPQPTPEYIYVEKPTIDQLISMGWQYIEGISRFLSC